MKNIIARIVNLKEFSNSKSTVLLEMVYDDLVTLLRFIHKSQKEGFLQGPFLFTNQIEYLDQMWHHFILHTKAYCDFCISEFGEYLHHDVGIPLEDTKKEEAGNDGEVIISQMKLLEDRLGVDFVRRIFFIYPELLK
nr:hypothetical protein CKG001_11200 [Bdellovibrio sp. CKG001]BFD62392.1 hypothetical protein BdHM001_10730 [Bdellovibrio sp. HM001]BFD67704.1 hypothetical protein HAGR004_27260 [Bdellovibrio sp. HAGR004]